MNRTVSIAAALALALGCGPVAAQSAAEVNARIEALFGDAKPFETAFRAVQGAIAGRDAAALARWISYPFRVSYDDEELVAPKIRHYPDEPDPLAGIDLDDESEQVSLAVRLAGGSSSDSDSFDLSAVAGSGAEVSSPLFRLPSDDELDLDDEAEPPPPQGPRVVVVPDDDDEDEVFSIDTEWGELDLGDDPAQPPSPPRSGLEREQSNARIVIEVLEDEAWPEDLIADDTPAAEGSAADSASRRSREGKS